MNYSNTILKICSFHVKKERLASDVFLSFSATGLGSGKFWSGPGFSTLPSSSFSNSFFIESSALSFKTKFCRQLWNARCLLTNPIGIKKKKNKCAGSQLFNFAHHSGWHQGSTSSPSLSSLYHFFVMYPRKLKLFIFYCTKIEAVVL